MKKIYTIVGCLALVSVGFSQNKPQTAEEAEAKYAKMSKELKAQPQVAVKPQVAVQPQVVIKNVKDLSTQEEITNVEKLIKQRLSLGKTEAQLANHYKELARLKKIVALKKEETK
jgi:hypothetical protein